MGLPDPCAAKLPTVLLEHRTADTMHHDWLLADPRLADQPDARLFTARLEPHSRAWAARGSWMLEQIKPHRRLYLTYQGPLSGGRGHVRQVDAGWFSPLHWCDEHMVIQLAMRHCQGLIGLRRVEANRWRAVWEAEVLRTDGGK